MKKVFHKSLAPLCLILLIAIATGVLDYFTPMMGDDMSKWLYMGGDSESFPDRRVISFLGAQYFGCNGRVFDALGPVITNLLPRCLTSMLMGLMTGFFFLCLCLAGGVMRARRAALACGVIVVSLLVLPWWDSMFMRVCHFNYVWASAFVLLFIYKWFREDTNKYLLFILGALAGCFHEQNGFSLVVVFGLYILLTRGYKRYLFPYVGLCLGALVTVATPAIWSRNADFLVDGSRLEMLWTTFPVLLFLVFLTVVILLKGGRLSAIVRSGKYIVLLSVAVVSSFVALYSTIPGRTGWLAESCSLAALGLLCTSSNFKITRAWAVASVSLCFLIVATHFAVSIYWQKKMYGEYQQAVELYTESDNGVVHMDYTSRLEVSPLTLYRVKGLTDGDDTHLLRVFQRHYGPEKPLILIDSEFEVAEAMPADARGLTNCISDTIMVVGNGPVRVVTPFFEGEGTRYLIQPLIVDPGDQWHKVE
ncbi:MAG: hypothetical protein K2K82_07535 [Muribaculaceae bacterium]|nr:hypothetical protein [Muribaculaceae bacterium]